MILTPSSTDAAQLKKEKYEKLLDEHYTRAESTVWGGWYDSELRDWLVGHGFLKSDAQAKRDEVGGVNLAAMKANDSSSISCLQSTRTPPRLPTSPGLTHDSEPSFDLMVLMIPSILPDPLSCTKSEVGDSCKRRGPQLTCSPICPESEQGRADSCRHSRDGQQWCRICRGQAFQRSRGESEP